ncbi:MAG: peptidoglycan DD-metalloendopeptidase family protein, partial [Bacteroidota bacterium]
MKKPLPTKYFLLFFLLFCGGMLLCPLNSYSQDKKAKLQQTKKEIEKEIEYTTKLLAETKKNKQASLNQINLLKNQIKKREELIDNINSELDELDGEINTHQHEIEQLGIQLKDLKAEYAKMIYYAYKNRNSYDRLLFIFASKDFNQAYKRLKYFKQYSAYRKKQADLIQNTQQRINQNISSLQVKKEDKVHLVNKQVNEKTKLTIEQEEHKTTITKLKQKEKELLATLREKEAVSRKLQKSIENIIAEEIRKAAEKAALKAAKKTVKKVTPPPNPKENLTVAKKVETPPPPTKIELTPAEIVLDNSFTNNKGKLPWPTEKGFISNTFGEHPHPVLKGIKTKNNGIDILTEKGAVARAVFNGVVTGIISLPNSQKAIIVRHGSYLSVYSNIETPYVKTSDNIKTKQSLGTIHY